MEWKKVAREPFTSFRDLSWDFVGPDPTPRDSKGMYPAWCSVGPCQVCMEKIKRQKNMRAWMVHLVQYGRGRPAWWHSSRYTLPCVVSRMREKRKKKGGLHRFELRYRWIGNRRDDQDVGLVAHITYCLLMAHGHGFFRGESYIMYLVSCYFIMSYHSSIPKMCVGIWTWTSSCPILFCMMNAP